MEYAIAATPGWYALICDAEDPETEDRLPIVGWEKPGSDYELTPVVVTNDRVELLPRVQRDSNFKLIGIYHDTYRREPTGPWTRVG